MTSPQWTLTQLAARLLEQDERDAVLGDLMETGERRCRALFDVLGLVSRRQISDWKGWHPWAAVFGLALPGSLLLMGFSVSICSVSEHLVSGALFGPSHPVPETLFQLACRSLLLLGGSWASGFVMGSMSRRTLCISIAACCLPCLFCLLRFREPSLSRFSLFLFIPPVIWGIQQALRLTRIKMSQAIFLAVAITFLTFFPLNNRGTWALNWSLVWPAWYVVIIAQRGRPIRTS